jgi:hypothetical protein
MAIAEQEETHLLRRRIVSPLLLWRRGRIPSLWRRRVVIPTEGWRAAVVPALALVTRWVVGHLPVVPSSNIKENQV